MAALVEKDDRIELTEDDLQEISDRFGLKTELPAEGTIAFQRLIETCKEYADAVDYQFKSDLVKVNDKSRTGSDKRRREIHNRLCIMLLGITWLETDKDRRDRISNFAVTVGDKPEYINQF